MFGIMTPRSVQGAGTEGPCWSSTQVVVAVPGVSRNAGWVRIWVRIWVCGVGPALSSAELERG